MTNEQMLGKISEINRLLKLDFSNLQSWKDIERNFPLNTVVDINGTVNTCLIKEDNRIQFNTIIPAGKKFPNHWHDFHEICTVLRGELIDKCSGKVWKSGEVVVFEPFQEHMPAAYGNQELRVIVNFYKT